MNQETFLPTETDEKWPFGTRLAWRFILTTLIWLFLSNTPLTLSPLWERILSRAIIVRDWSVSFASLLILFLSLKCPRWLSRTVSSARLWRARSSGIPLFSDSLYWSTLFVYFLQPVTGQYLGLRAPPHFYLQSPSRQTSINGARWGDNEAPRQRLSEVGEWQRHTELSLSHRNERRAWKRSEAASRTNAAEFGKLIPLCLA